MVVRYSKRKAIGTLVASLVVLGAAGWAAVTVVEVGTQLAAAALGVIAAVAVVQSLRRFWREEPMVAITEGGFLDRRGKMGMIPWADIEDVTVTRVRRQPFVSLHLRHPEVYLQNYSETARMLGKVEAAVGLGDLQVACSNLDHSAEEIAAECLLHLIR